jgi:N-acetylmuramoyl-L-alanine amidase
MPYLIEKFLILVAAVAVMSPPAGAVPPKINVVYPRLGDTLTTVDSTFILGSVTPGAALWINGSLTAVHEEGGFIAFLPVSPGVFDFELMAISGDDTSVLLWPIYIRPHLEFSYDSLTIIKNQPGLTLGLRKGEILSVEFMGTPGCIASFSLPGIVDSVPMAEILPVANSSQANSAFGTLAATSPKRFGGHYQGYMEVPDTVLDDSLPVMFHLRAPTLAELVEILKKRPVENIDFAMLNLLRYESDAKSDSSGIFVRLNPSEYPSMVEFRDSVQTIRIGPGKGYLTIFQPRGVLAQATGYEGDWLKLRLSPSEIGWVNKGSVRFLEKSRPPVISYPRTVRTIASDTDVTVIVPLVARHPFRIVEEDNKTLTIDLFGVNADTDWIRYDSEDNLIGIITWRQVEPELFRLTIRTNRSIWGYDADYEGNIFRLKLLKPPNNVRKVKGLVIVIDPGHAADPGAVGPTGLKESEANLAIASTLRDKLSAKGAEVIMTRDDMSHVPLYERPSIAKRYGADLFVSIHNNALPDGLNPFVNNGVSTYYYHPHSIGLARNIQRELRAATGLKDFGTYHGNLAVARPTQYPAVLVETAFIILPEQEALLKNPEFRQKVATAIQKGIERFLKEYE